MNNDQLVKGMSLIVAGIEDRLGVFGARLSLSVDVIGSPFWSLYVRNCVGIGSTIEDAERDLVGSCTARVEAIKHELAEIERMAQ